MGTLAAAMLAGWLTLGGVGEGLQEPPREGRDRGGWGVMPVFGFHAGSPERARGSVGFFVFKRTHNSYGAPGFGLSVEPGLDGGRLSFAAGHFSFFGSTFGRLTVLRTWDEPWQVPGNRTYVGFELQTPIPYVPASAIRLGALRDTDDGFDWRFVWSVGVGF
ncbi:MAG TPA: hypothetical protein VMV46_02370 [Thermoanaerobaculia bacterium]|nr:hypothetical protein [Thermoanaerobaculia bacterium]